MAKVFKLSGLIPQVYMSFKDLASKNGYAVASVLEKIIEDEVKFGLVFPSAKNAASEAQARRANFGLSLINNQHSGSIWQKGAKCGG